MVKSRSDFESGAFNHSATLPVGNQRLTTPFHGALLNCIPRVHLAPAKIQTFSQGPFSANPGNDAPSAGRKGRGSADRPQSEEERRNKKAAKGAADFGRSASLASCGVVFQGESRLRSRGATGLVPLPQKEKVTIAVASNDGPHSPSSKRPGPRSRNDILTLGSTKRTPAMRASRRVGGGTGNAVKRTGLTLPTVINVFEQLRTLGLWAIQPDGSVGGGMPTLPIWRC